jgi:hypothetical protein
MHEVWSSLAEGHDARAAVEHVSLLSNHHKIHKHYCNFTAQQLHYLTANTAKTEGVCLSTRHCSRISRLLA